MNGAEPRALGARGGLVAGLAFAGLALLLYGPALRGPLLSDDWIYFTNRPYMDALTWANVRTILDPFGDPVILTWNWAPLHLLAHSALRAVFGSYAETYPHHVVNVLVHAANATLLLALFVAHGVPRVAAAAAALLFLVHPANVEAVAWIFQLKTLLSFTLAFAALRLLARRPGLATLAFAAALLVKPSAAAVLPAALVFEWLRAPGAGEPVRRTRWLAVWALLFVAYALPELAAFRNTGEFRVPLPADERALQALAIVGRYAVLVFGFGASTFHQPEPPQSLADGWLALGVVTLLVLGVLSVGALRRRHPAAPWLVLAAASYAPVSQVLAFLYPMADRYLYFVLPGLLGAALVTAAPWLARSTRGGLAAWREPRAAALALGVAGLAGGFAWQAHARAEVFGSAERFARDSVLHYPNGLGGQLARARKALVAGDPAGALDALEAAHARGYRSALVLLGDPLFRQLAREPRFEALVQRMARDWLARADTLPRVGPEVLVDRIRHELLLGDAVAARASLARLEAQPGRIDATLRRQLLADIERVASQAAPVR